MAKEQEKQEHMKPLVLEGKVAIVTGGARGIGRACERMPRGRGSVADIILRRLSNGPALGESALAVFGDGQLRA